ncbi:MAG: DUF3990 domain-containing protein [Lachnospiraceae bacterium]|jgi:hypothetical protein|nr:DUF3990 domain-containing protein [Lachnospiraceae bacterium]
MAIITLYHGSTYEIETIDVNRGKPWKDFGKGFYISRTESQAEWLAIRNRRIENDLRVENGSKPNAIAWVYQYEFENDNLPNLNVKEFSEPNDEWVRFVVLSERERSNEDGSNDDRSKSSSF